MKILILAALFSYTTTHSQGTPSLDFMKGSWKGSGWKMTQEGKMNSTVTENVECRIDCSVYVVQGKGTKFDSASNADIVVHDAFGTINYDKAKGKWVLRAFKKEGMTESELTFISDKKFIWSMEIPGGQGTIRFTTDFSSGKWVEIGEFSRDKGATWMQMMWMSLEKQE
jgi:hypothetical protein